MNSPFGTLNSYEIQYSYEIRNYSPHTKITYLSNENFNTFCVKVSQTLEYVLLFAIYANIKFSVGMYTNLRTEKEAPRVPET